MNLTLLTDLYQLTMAYGYWKSGLYNREAVFHLFYRKNPFKGQYAICSGLEMVIDYLNNFRFSVQDIQYLGRLKGADGKALFDESFLNYLQRLQFSCDIDAISEGTMVFAHEPLIRVKGPLLQCQLIETALLNMVNFSTLIATKAARIVQAAKGDTILEFGLRRAQGVDGGLIASRAAYIGGCHATSNVLAGRIYDIPVKGTHAHSWIMCFEDELTAFQQYADTMPNNCIFLVDTYDTIEGVKNAIQVGKILRKKGHEMLGIRLDSGDLADLSKAARQLLDEAGFPNAAVVASNDLDEYKVKMLKEKGATISVWGIGTRLVTAYDQAALGGVYKLAAIKNEQDEWDYKVKLSEQAIKVSNPGILQVRRFSAKGIPIGDVIFDKEMMETDTPQMIPFKKEKPLSFPSEHSENLLKPIFKRGKQVYSSPSIHDIRQNTLEQLSLFQNVDLDNYPTGLEKNLWEKKKELVEKFKSSRGSKVQNVFP